MRALVWSMVLVWSAFATGCGGNDDSGGGGAGGGGAGAGGSGGVTALDCSNRCANKLDTCGAPASETATRCNPICIDQKATETELKCIENTDCAALLQAFTNHEGKCGLQLGSGGTGGTGDAG